MSEPPSIPALRRVYNAFRSKYLAVALMTAVMIAAVIGLIYPQADQATAPQAAAWSRAHPLLWGLGKPIQATRAFSSWWFLAAAGLLLVNGSLCLLEQIEKAIKLTRKRGFALSARMARPTAEKRIALVRAEPQAVLEAVAETLSRAGLHVRRGAHEGKPALLAVGHGWTQWSTVVFHAALLLTLVSVVLVSLTFGKGQFRVVVGGGFADAPGAYGRYARGAFGPRSLGGWVLRLNRFNPRHRRGTFKPGPASTVLVETASGEKINRLLTRGEYFDVDGTNIFESGGWGFAPVLTVIDPSGRSRTGAVIMRRHGPSGNSPVANFDVADDVVGQAELQEFTNSTSFKPKLRVKLSRGNRRVFSSTLSPRGTIRAAGYSVTYDDLRYWSEFTAVRSPWLAGVNLAFWLLVAGASVMYIWPATYAWALVRTEDGGNAVYLGGRREKFSREFAGLVEHVKADLSRAEETE